MFSMPVKNCKIRILPPLNPHVMGSPLKLTRMQDTTIDSLTLRHYSLARYSTIQNDPSLKSSKKLNNPPLFQDIHVAVSEDPGPARVCRTRPETQCEGALSTRPEELRTQICCRQVT